MCDAIRVCPVTDAVCAFQGACDAQHCVELLCKDQRPAAPASPVRTVTRKEIVPGTYGPDARLNIETGTDDASVFIELDDDWYKANEIREFARLLNEIADAMEDSDGR